MIGGNFAVTRWRARAGDEGRSAIKAKFRVIRRGVLGVSCTTSAGYVPCSLQRTASARSAGLLELARLHGSSAARSAAAFSAN